MQLRGIDATAERVILRRTLTTVGAVLLTFAASQAVAHQAPEEAVCTVTQSQREAARTLEWFDFDQVSTGPASFRVLANAGCHRAALDAYADWLEYGPGFPDIRSRAIGTFHRGQLHAMLGENAVAQELMRQAYRIIGDDDPQAAVWNVYLDGVLAWFSDDTATIGEAQTALRTFDTPFALRQMEVLEGLRNCLGRSYREAMSPTCRADAEGQSG